MEGVEEDSRVWIWESGWELGRGGGQECGHLGHRCMCGVWGHPGGGDEQTFGRSWGEPGTRRNQACQTHLYPQRWSPVLSPCRVGAPGSGGCLHLLPHLYRLALHCAQVSPMEAGLPGWEGAMGVASPADVRAYNFSFT